MLQIFLFEGWSLYQQYQQHPSACENYRFSLLPWVYWISIFIIIILPDNSTARQSLRWSNWQTLLMDPSQTSPTPAPRQSHLPLVSTKDSSFMVLFSASLRHHAISPFWDFTGAFLPWLNSTPEMSWSSRKFSQWLTLDQLPQLQASLPSCIYMSHCHWAPPCIVVSRLTVRLYSSLDRWIL